MPGWLSLQAPGDATPRFLQAALTGAGCFVVALLANQLAARLAREEQRGPPQPVGRAHAGRRSTNW